jgi:hypothetical protein
MGKRREPYAVRVARELCDKLQATFVNWTTSGGGHLKIEVERGGVRRTIFTAATPSDHRAEMNNRQTVKRVIQSLPLSAAS